MGTFRRATKKRRKLKIFTSGPTSSGKTYTSLEVASRLVELDAEREKAPPSRIVVIDTEHGAAADYATDFDFDHAPLRDSWEGDKLKRGYDPRRLVTTLQVCAQEGYGVVLIDGLSQFWNGPGGVLEIVDGASNNKFSGWRVGTPVQNRMVNAILQYPGHVIVTMRVDDEYVVSGDGKPRKVGLRPVQRKGLEFEFMFGFLLDEEHNATVVKTRNEERFALGQVFEKPDGDIADLMFAWLEQDVDEEAEAAAEAQRAAQRAAASAGDDGKDADDVPPTSGPAASSTPTEPTPSQPAEGDNEAVDPFLVKRDGENVAQRDVRIAYRHLHLGHAKGPIASDEHVSSAVVRKAISKWQAEHDEGKAPWHVATAASSVPPPAASATTSEASATPPAAPTTTPDPAAQPAASAATAAEAWGLGGEDPGPSRNEQLFDQRYGELTALRPNAEWANLIGRKIREMFDRETPDELNDDQLGTLVELMTALKLDLEAKDAAAAAD
jgi:hypothetical protein